MAEGVGGERGYYSLGGRVTARRMVDRGRNHGALQEDRWGAVVYRVSFDNELVSQF